MSYVYTNSWVPLLSPSSPKIQILSRSRITINITTLTQNPKPLDTHTKVTPSKKWKHPHTHPTNPIILPSSPPCFTHNHNTNIPPHILTTQMVHTHPPPLAKATNALLVLSSTAPLTTPNTPIDSMADKISSTKKLTSIHIACYYMDAMVE